MHLLVSLRLDTRPLSFPFDPLSQSRIRTTAGLRRPSSSSSHSAPVSILSCLKTSAAGVKREEKESQDATAKGLKVQARERWANEDERDGSSRTGSLQNPVWRAPSPCRERFRLMNGTYLERRIRTFMRLPVFERGYDRDFSRTARLFSSTCFQLHT